MSRFGDLGLPGMRIFGFRASGRVQGFRAFRAISQGIRVLGFRVQSFRAVGGLQGFTEHLSV